MADDVTQTDGTMSGTVFATNYDISGGTIAGTGVVTVGGEVTISGTARVDEGSWLLAADDLPFDAEGNTIYPTITQNGDDSIFDGRVSSMDAYGYLQQANYFTSYTLAAGLIDTHAYIVTGDLFDQNGGTMNGTANTWIYNLRSGTLGGTAIVAELNSSGGDVRSGAEVDFIHTVTISGGTWEDGSKIVAMPWGPDNGHIVQTAGTINGAATAVTYDMSGGDMGGTAVIDISDHFNLSGDATIESGATIKKGDPRRDLGQISYDDDGNPFYEDDGTVPSPIDTFAQSGGTMNGNVTTDIYTQSGGALGGTVTTGTYDLMDASATSTDATITASSAFTLEPATGIATVDAKLTGTGKLTKSGAGTVVLSNGANDFSGGIAIDAGTLDAINDALPDNAAVTIANAATLEMTIDKDVATSFGGAITGAAGKVVKDGAGTLTLTGAIDVADLDIDDGTLHVSDNALANTAAVNIGDTGTLRLTIDSGSTVVIHDTLTGADGTLVKDGAGTLTLGGSVYLGKLDVNAGWLNIGTGAANSTDEASFDSAVIASGATVYVAKGATLTIRVPNNLVNFGTLTNDGTVHDDLDNHNVFANDHVFDANVTANTGTIDNNTPGLWTGNVLSNAGTITNNVGATWNGAVDGNTGYIINKGRWTGAVNSNGSSGYPVSFMMIYNDKGATWIGDVVDNHASIRNVAGTWRGKVDDNYTDIINDNSGDELDSGYWYGDVVANHNLIFNAGGGIWTGDILSNDGRILSDRPAHHTVATDDAQWHGNVLGNAGSIESRAFWYGDVRGNGGSVTNNGWWAGDVYAGNTGTVSNVEDDYGAPVYDTIRPTWTGTVLGNAGRVLNLSGDWIGDVVTNAGTVSNAAGSTWRGNVLANSGTIITAGIWNGSFTNSNGGRVKAQGQINGDFGNAGTLYITGALTGIGSLTNYGTLDLRNGGGAGQTLTVTTANLQSGSTLAVSLDTAGNADKLVATTAALGGTVNVTLNPIVGNSDYTRSYTILDAVNRTGTFSGVTTDLAFLAPTLSYGTPGDVNLALVRNQQSFETIASTPNQKAAAAAIEALGAGNPVYGAILGLTPAEAEDAFDQLGGASQTSTHTADLQAANLVSHILAGRINQAFDAIGGDDGTTSNYAHAPAIVETPSPTSGVWGQFYGASGSVASTPIMAGVNSTTGGFAAGLDGQLGNWRVGVVVDAGATGISVPDLNSSSSSFDYGVGVYGGGEFGNMRLSVGADYTRHAVSSSRHVLFPGFDETLTADYAAGTAQAFAQLSQEFDFGATSLTPYAGLDYAADAIDGYTERGGAAALTSAPNLIDATFTTLGITARHKFVVGDDMLLSADAGLGWRHGFADTPSAVNSFAGGASFTVLGAPLPADMAVVNAGLNLDISATTTLNLTYDGQFATGVQTHGLKASWNGKF